ncbi:PREDICTED: trihelix transcription factor GT-2-like [Tarenaya hassleriana]|uniref:trihelix transcription factor GT-2-like n=1 Tax=Tarenaya hassleriana TaxID=28532 RepID=UPI00053C1965|nr:PREDICTED: trihelix transcription factor GT-2-like [Tarenaya hassleriana]
MVMELGGGTTTAAAASQNSGADAAVERLEGHDEETSRRGFGGNRWPRQETLALLKIRSDMDTAFRHASAKGPLWDEVSRKMLEIGYNRSAKKCREKFENVYKYHKRTKEGRTRKSQGKTYRFFDQLDALQTQPQPQSQSPQPPSVNADNPPTCGVALATVTSTMPPPYTSVPPVPDIFCDFPSDSAPSSSSSSDMETGGGTRKKRKKKWKDFFERMVKKVVEKQEELQTQFLETLEKRENERMVREEAWRMEEMARIKREREILSQERSNAAAKDATVMTLLQKQLSENPSLSHLSTHAPPPPQTQILQPPPPQTQPNETATSPSPSRWPKVEIEALIKLRTNLDSKYHENGSQKGPMWEEVSAGMRRLGFNRSAKRCKEKWENINKYFKKVKESNKKRPVDSKTCPYYHQLDVLYREKNNMAMASTSTSSTSMVEMKPKNTVPLVVQPEQQWPPAARTEPRPRPETQIEDVGLGENSGRNPDQDRGREMDGEEEEDDDDGSGGEFEIVPSK